ncbi:AraC family transcriptional regulator [Sebaldella sp. S0638]|uniref:AraC family transcriptional regulator n=1 Tax=Sebaldella sp. S0638 TaxID=2957809 RepID=UPI0020A12A12|nr:AraC family transcriptional regulator [Sebaldella sp. S0638]MCP1224546.1 AraC family transcriptional regulator [Sebaldella sp. S0638]
MGLEKRRVYLDRELEAEAYWFYGIMQKFPNHFHEYYVIGFVENGQRRLYCKNKDYIINPGDMVVLNPFDSHTCLQVNDEALDWRCINIKKEVMKEAVEKIYGYDYLPVFSKTVFSDDEILSLLKELHSMIVIGSESSETRRAVFYKIIEKLFEKYTEQDQNDEITATAEIRRLCRYMENNYCQKLSLDDFSKIAGQNKFTLLRNFNKIHGLTPYQYLETIRIEKARIYLEEGSTPAETALNTGFSDQSHFTRFFKSLIGLTPKQYQKLYKESI